jgi:hypothetical protein
LVRRALQVSLPEGKVTLKTAFTPAGPKAGGGTLRLYVDGKPAGEGTLERSVFRHGLEPFEDGRDSITPVDPAYKDKGKFAFTGKIEKVTFRIVPGNGTRADPLGLFRGEHLDSSVRRYAHISVHMLQPCQIARE